MKRFMFLLLCGLSIVVFCAGVGHAAGRNIRVLLIDGESAGPYHNWQLTTPIL
jgi:hypothetical protein